MSDQQELKNEPPKRGTSLVNPYPSMRDKELLLCAEEHVKTQEILAAKRLEDFTLWHHMFVAWLIRELVARLKNVQHPAP